jgi:hypothetical protein
MVQSDSEVSDEPDEDQCLEEITAEVLKGRWLHSGGDYLNCSEGSVKFDEGLQFTMETVDNTVEMEGWRALPEKSTSNKIVWGKEGEASIFWRFESEYEDPSALDEEVEASNIITGKRRRTGVDYAALDKTMAKEAGYEDEEDKDHDEVAERARKKAKMDALAGRPEAKKEVVPKKLSGEELTAINTLLGSAGDLKSAEEVRGAFASLQAHPMTLAELKATKIGVTVNRYKKHTNSGIKSQAAECVVKWKTLLSK